MSADGPHSDWPAPVIGFLAEALPRETSYGCDGWIDYAMTAWQFGCIALEALGQAQEEQWGASRLQDPALPGVLPRWDDICWVVLSVLAQRREIVYRLPDGTPYQPPVKPGQFVIKPIYPEGQEPKVPPPNIAAAHGAGPARVAEAHLPVLEALGLVAEGAWTQEAELVLWREQPRAWDMAVMDDPRFEAGLTLCLETMPDEVVETLHDLVEITPDDITAAVARQEQANADLIAKYPAQAKFDWTVTREGKFRTLVSVAENDMDWLFFRAWRLPEGWLPGPDAERALPLFHDPLAKQMRRASLAALGLSFPSEMPE